MRALLQVKTITQVFLKIFKTFVCQAKTRVSKNFNDFKMFSFSNFQVEFNLDFK